MIIDAERFPATSILPYIPDIQELTIEEGGFPETDWDFHVLDKLLGTHPRMTRYGEEPNSQTLLHKYLVIAGGSLAGKWTLIQKLLEFYGEFYQFLVKTTGRNLRPGENPDNVRCLPETEYLARLQESNYTTFLTSLEVALVEGLFDYDERTAGFSFQMMASFFMKDLEKQVEESESQNKNLVVELSFWDAIAWKMYHPNTEIYWLTADINEIFKRFFHRTDYSLGIKSSNPQIRAYTEQRMMEAIRVNVQLPPELFQISAAFKKAFLNNTMNDCLNNVHLIHGCFQQDLRRGE